VAKVEKFKIPFAEVDGHFYKLDYSKGRDGGLLALLSKERGQIVYKVMKHRAYTKTPAMLAREARYGDCDMRWKFLKPQKFLHLKAWWRWARDLHQWNLPEYQTWMHGCLSAMPEMECFVKYCWVGRYRWRNTSDIYWPIQALYLTGVPSWDSSWRDNEVHRLYADNRLGEVVPSCATSPGVLEIVSHGLAPGHIMTYDVYAWASP
jgi:hypothetical protein